MGDVQRCERMSLAKESLGGVELSIAVYKALRAEFKTSSAVVPTDCEAEAWAALAAILWDACMQEHRDSQLSASDSVALSPRSPQGEGRVRGIRGL